MRYMFNINQEQILRLSHHFILQNHQRPKLHRRIKKKRQGFKLVNEINHDKNGKRGVQPPDMKRSGGIIPENGSLFFLLWTSATESSPSRSTTSWSATFWTATSRPATFWTSTSWPASFWATTSWPATFWTFTPWPTTPWPWMAMKNILNIMLQFSNISCICHYNKN